MKKGYSLEELTQKLASFCAYQERSKQDVRRKLQTLGATSAQTDEVLAWLEEENFLNEKRFAASFARGHFVYKQWGKRKIRYALEGKGLKSTYIEQAIAQEIDEESYLNTLLELMRKKCEALNPDLSLLEKRQKVQQYALGKGYEPELVQERWKELSSSLKER